MVRVDKVLTEGVGIWWHLLWLHVACIVTLCDTHSDYVCTYNNVVSSQWCSEAQWLCAPHDDFVYTLKITFCILTMTLYDIMAVYPSNDFVWICNSVYPQMTVCYTHNDFVPFKMTLCTITMTVRPHNDLLTLTMTQCALTITYVLL